MMVSYLNELNTYFNYHFFVLQFIIYYAAYIAADSDASDSEEATGRKRPKIG